MSTPHEDEFAPPTANSGSAGESPREHTTRGAWEPQTSWQPSQGWADDADRSSQYSQPSQSQYGSQYGQPQYDSQGQSQYGPSQYSQPSQSQYDPQGQPSYGSQYGEPGQSQYGQPYGQVAPSSYGQYGAASDQTVARTPGHRTVIPMRPLSVGDTLDATLRLLKFNPVALIVFPMIVSLVAGVITAGLTALYGEIYIADGSIRAVGSSGIAGIVTIVLSIVSATIMSLAGTRVVLAAIRGRKITLHETFSLASKKLGIFSLRVVGLTIIWMLISFVAMMVFGIIMVAFFSGANFQPESFMGVLALILIFVLIGALIAAAILARFVPSLPAMIAEDIGPIRAIRRSWTLTKGSLAYMLGTILSVVVIAWVISFAWFFLASALLSAIGTLDNGTIAAGAIAVAVMVPALLSVFITPLLTTLVNVVYVNMRFKRENFHQELLYEAANG